VLSLRAERAYVARTIVHKTVPDHLVLPLEAFAAFATVATFHRAIVRSALAVDILVRTVLWSVILIV
jgi:hypothetical protein